MKRAMGPGLRGAERGGEGMRGEGMRGEERRGEERRDGALENEDGRRLIFSPHACRAEPTSEGEEDILTHVRRIFY